jgi:predicted SAM-dependent methyltransferase
MSKLKNITNKIFKLIRNPTTEYKKIIPFIMILLRKVKRNINPIKQYQTKKENAFIKNEYNRLANSYKKYKKVKLHFGCGARVIKGWINIDLSYTHYEEYLKYYTDEYYPESIRGDKDDFFVINILKTGLPLPDESVDLIFHEDFLEHLDQKEQIIFLAETFRVMKKGSVHRINTPDLLTSMSEHSDFKKGKTGVYVGEWDKHIHKNLLTNNYLTEISKIIGYSNTMINSRNNSLSKEIPKEYRPGTDRTENGNIFADLIK